MNICFGDSVLCFICGKEVTGYRVHWDGWRGDNIIDIDLHRDCADFMAAGLKRDVLEFVSGPQVPISGITNAAGSVQRAWIEKITTFNRYLKLWRPTTRN
jgi:hypothetical protein